MNLTTKHDTERLELARQLFREFYALCFRHTKPDLLITEEMILWLVKELRRHGGRRGMLAAARLTGEAEGYKHWR